MDTSLAPQSLSAMLNLSSAVSVEVVARIYSASGNANTNATRASHLKMMEEYCRNNGWGWREDGVEGFEEGWLVSHITELYASGKALSTIDGRIDAIHAWSLKNGKRSPLTGFVKDYRLGMGNELSEENQKTGRRVRKEAPALTREVLHRVIDCIDTTTLVGIRDRALLLMGWHGAYRRSELATLNRSNVTEWSREGGRYGLLCKVYNTKTDKVKPVEKQIEAQPTAKYCPVKAYNEWLSASGITDGPVFRAVDRWGNVSGSLSDRAVDKILRKYATGFSAHSLRAGYATQSVEDGIPEVYARKQGGWAYTSNVFGSYASRAELGKVLRVRPV